ncbi:hypothetical protein MKX01_032032 [Papaver californicum]|nr:hypothetical protein MKX01_032032 [Papaver californicum]
MTNKVISQMGLLKSIANIFASRNILTSKDAFSLTEFDLMELLDAGMSDVNLAVTHISEMTCPPYQTALSLMEERVQNEYLAGHLPTRLKGLDEALRGGVPFGALKELVGPAGIGKTQIGAESFPEIFQLERMAQEMAGRILVLRPTSLAEFTESLQQVKLSILQNQIKLLIIDSMAGFVSSENDRDVKAPKQHSLGWHISFIKSLAEFSWIPVVVTNQVRSQNCDELVQYPFQAENKHDIVKDPERLNSHLVAALGIHWAHAVTIRLVLESDSGQRYIKVAKSPISPPLVFPFIITSSGISLISDNGIEVKGPEIHSIHCQGNLWLTF